MISGNNNRSPQYGTMGPKGERPSSRYHFQQQQPQQQQQHLLFMAGGSVKTLPQMSQGFSTKSNGGPLRPTVVQCNMQQNFASGYGYSNNSAPIFQPHYQYQQPSVHYRRPVRYVHQSYVSTPAPPAANHLPPTSGFINGIKNMVKGLFNPLNCDFYSDHHKYYNPKYRNNYKLDIAGEKMSYTPHQPEPHVKPVVFDCVNIGESKSPAASPAYVPKPNQTAVPQNSPKKTTSEVFTIFTSEDFPELPAPRRNRSTTPAKTEKTPTPERLTKLHAECAKSNQTSVQTPKSSSHSLPPTAAAAASSKEPSPSSDAKPKSISFEIKYTATPCERRPTFGGRLKVVAPPFSLNKFHRTCRTNCQEVKPHEDCDTGDDSFVIFQNERPDECVLTALGACRPQRQRQLSECSDDSFVVFSTEEVDNILPTFDVTDDESEDDESDDDDDDDDDEETTSEEEEEVDSGSDDDNDEWIDNGHDVVDSSFGKIKTDSNKCAGVTVSDPDVYFVEAENAQFDSGFDEKKVTFNPKPIVHVMHTWNYAYRAARKGHWENYARDRGRFRVRIERASTILNPILTPEHREKIYQERFRDKSDEQQQQQQVQAAETNLKSDKRSAHNSTVQSDDSQILPKSAEVTLC